MFKVNVSLKKFPSLNKTKAKRDIALKLKSNVEEQFDKSRDPYDRPWRKLSKVTIRRKKSSKILIDHGFLRKSVDYRLKRNSVLLFFGKKYAKYHQYGTIRIPTRLLLPVKSLGLPAKWSRDIENILKRSLKWK